MWKRVLASPNSGTATIARVVLGAVMLPHGAQKMLGWFGGYGWDRTMAYFTQSLHVPAVFAVLAILAEFFGALGLLFGLLGRVAAFGISCVMLVAAITVHLGNGFFMDWFGSAAGEGFEFHLLALGLGILVMIRGSGALSIDRWLVARQIGTESSAGPAVAAGATPIR